MYLYLMRHGEAVSKLQNPERPLTGRGKYEVGKMATHLKAIKVLPQQILHSEILRAKQTAQIVAEKLEVVPNLAVMKSLNADFDIYSLIADVNKLAKNTFLVGHLPNIGMLSNYLLTGNIDKSTILFSTATVACFERKDNQWSMKWFIDPLSIKS